MENSWGIRSNENMSKTEENKQVQEESDNDVSHGLFFSVSSDTSSFCDYHCSDTTKELYMEYTCVDNYSKPTTTGNLLYL